MRATRAGLCVFLGWVYAAGCSVLVPPGELSRDSEAIPDGGGPVVDGELPDSEEPKVDSGEDSDNPALPPFDAAPFSCLGISPQPTFCTDFDQPAYDGGFTLSIPTAGARSGFDTAIQRSAPYAWFVELDQDSGANYAFMKRAFPNSTREITYSFDYYLQDVVPTKNTLMAGIQFGGGAAPRRWISLYVGDTGAALEEKLDINGPNQTYHFFGASHTVPVKQWTRVSLHLVLGPTSQPAITAAFNGKVVATGQLDAVWTSGAPEMMIGIIYAGDRSKSWRMLYDNVIFDVK